MHRERFSAGGLIAVGASLALLAAGAALAWKFDFAGRVRGSSVAPLTSESEQPAYLVLDSLPPVSTSTKDQLPELILAAFRMGRLYAAEKWPVQNDSKLVFASPTVSGKPETIACGSQSYPYCGLYLVTPTSTSLVAWGDALTGFKSVERVPDADHAVLLQSWSFLNYSIIERKELNLKTGAIVPLLALELDVSDEFAELQASGQGRNATLLITGESQQSRLIPKTLIIRDEKDKTRFSLPSGDVQRLAEASLSGERKPPVAVEPSKDDVDSGQINLLLFGVPYELDIKAYKLTVLTSN